MKISDKQILDWLLMPGRDMAFLMPHTYTLKWPKNRRAIIAAMSQERKKK